MSSGAILWVTVGILILLGLLNCSVSRERSRESGWRPGSLFSRRGDPDHGIHPPFSWRTARPVSQKVCGTDADHWLDADRLCGSLPRLFWSGEHFTAFASDEAPA